MKSLLLLLFTFSLAAAGAGQSLFHDSDEQHNSLPCVRSPDVSAAAPAGQGSGTARANWSATTGAPMLASPKFEDLDGDGTDEIILPTYGITNPYGEGWLHAWTGSGAVVPGFPVFLTGAPPGTPAIGDLDNDGSVEIVQGTWNYIYVFNADGTTFPGWPKASYVTQNAALADLDGDGDLEIIVPSSSSMNVYHHDGNAFPGFPVSGSNDLTGPAVADIDGDGDLEIAAGSYKASGSPTDHVYVWHHDGTPAAGFPVTTAGSVKVPPVVADLDGDGNREIIADCWSQAATDFLYVWDSAGNAKPGWPINIGYIRLSSPSVADLDLDGDLEIVVGGWSTNPYGEEIHALHHDASAAAGFPVILNNSPSGNVNSTCTTGDIDGDGFPEIVIKAVNNIFALNHDGSIAAGFPVFIDDENHSGTTSPTPAIGDPDGDGLAEIFAASSFNNVTLLDQDGVYSDDVMPWPTFRLDPLNRGHHVPPSLVCDVHTLSAAAGGVVHFSLDAGPVHAGRVAIVAGSMSGTKPGTLLPGGLATIPLNRDFFTNYIIANLSSPMFVNFLGALDGAGSGAATLDTLGPIPPVWVGRTTHFAFAVTATWNFASNTVAVKIVP